MIEKTSELPVWMADFFLENFSENIEVLNSIVAVVASNDGESDYVKLFKLEWASHIETEVIEHEPPLNSDLVASVARYITRANKEDATRLLHSDNASAELAGMMMVVENRDRPGFFTEQINEVIAVGGIPAVILLIQSEDDSTDILSTLLIADIASIEGFIHPGFSLNVPTSVQ